MGQTKLNKLQIRAEVVGIISQLATLGNKSQQEYAELVKKLISIEPFQDVIDILIKELKKSNASQMQVIVNVLSETGTIDKLRDPLWEYITDPSVSDDLKTACNVVLRNLGDTTDPNLYLNYLSDPKAIIDKETDKMLEAAYTNPEAQIDFIDFLASLSEREQEELVYSLMDDYEPPDLVMLFAPLLESDSASKIAPILISFLGNSRSSRIAKILQTICDYSTDDLLKKKCKQSLNILKIAGIKLDDTQETLNNPMLTESKIYHCYVNPPDGIGNQGIIIARKKEDESITMFSVIINDLKGIIDCFGFYQISEEDYNRIIDRFSSNSPRQPVNPSYCKSLLSQMENINWREGDSFPYEYAAWKVLLADLEPMDKKLEDLASQWVNMEFAEETNLLYSHPDFFYWFIEKDDIPQADTLFEESIHYILNAVKSEIPNIDEITDWHSTKITEYLPQIISDKYRKIYYDRLINTAYIFNENNILTYRDLAATAARGLLPDSPVPLAKQPFLLALVERSLYENAMRYINSPDIKLVEGFSEEKISSLKDLIENLYNQWSVYEKDSGP